MTDVTSFTPNWVSPPGETIADLLEERGWTQADLAHRLSFTSKHVNELVQGKAALSADAASRLATVLGSTAGFWLRREAQYRAALEAQRVREQRLSEADWLGVLAVADMARFGWIKRLKDRADQVTECLKFFGVASIESWRDRYEHPVAAFRAAKGKSMNVGAVAAWLRQGEREAEMRPCQPFDEKAFRAALQDIRAMTNATDPKVFVPQLLHRSAECGVAVVFVPTPRGCPASGVTKWLGPGKALLMLSLRHRTNDHLWFTFFHEAAHLLLHGKRMQFIEGLEPVHADCEAEADAFARDHLIPPSGMNRLRELARGGIVSKVAVKGLATEFGIAPGIVVGRMQKEELIPWTHLNDLKVRYTWTEPPTPCDA